MPMSQRWLLVDADDTLWENNIYFEEAFAQFVEFLGHSRLNSSEIRDRLDEIETEAIKVNGYGALNFGRNLQECFRQLAERPVTENELEKVLLLALRILEKPVDLIEGVESTLAYLAERYHLTLFSKGCPDEQQRKLARSGLERYFDGCSIVKEKHVASYREVVKEHSIETEHAWMVGNSPKSDINPALEAGLGAVLVPHVRTWRLEHEETPEPSDRFYVLERFEDLKSVF